MGNAKVSKNKTKQKHQPTNKQKPPQKPIKYEVCNQNLQPQPTDKMRLIFRVVLFIAIKVQ